MLVYKTLIYSKELNLERHIQLVNDDKFYVYLFVEMRKNFVTRIYQNSKGKPAGLPAPPQILSILEKFSYVCT